MRTEAEEEYYSLPVARTEILDIPGDLSEAIVGYSSSVKIIRTFHSSNRRRAFFYRIKDTESGIEGIARSHTAAAIEDWNNQEA